MGAGVAGLRAAAELTRDGLHVAVLEASDGPGGRVRSDTVDGLTLDRGFQVLNPAYPAVRARLSLPALRLRPFLHGVVVATGGRRVTIADPLRHPQLAAGLLRAPLGGPVGLARLATMSLRDATRPAALLRGADERTVAEDLRARGIAAEAVEQVIAPFLRGVFLTAGLDTSSTLFHLVWRSFLRGVPAVPSTGMGAVGLQLAAALPAGTVRYGARVEAVRPGAVSVAGGDPVTARAIVVGTDGVTAAGLLPGFARPAYNAVTTYYHLADERPTDSRAILVDGDGVTPIVSSAVLTNVAPEYASRYRSLVSTSILGADPLPEQEIRRHLRGLYGVPTERWEHVRTYSIASALPAQRPPAELRSDVRVGDGRYVAGDHRDTASLQGAMVSGSRVAAAVLADLRCRPG